MGTFIDRTGFRYDLRLRSRGSVLLVGLWCLMCVVLDNIMWGNLSWNLQDVTPDAQNYEGIASMYGISQAILYSHEYYALAGNLGYEGQAYQEPFMSPSSLSVVMTSEGSALAEGDVP